VTSELHRCTWWSGNRVIRWLTSLTQALSSLAAPSRFMWTWLLYNAATLACFARAVSCLIWYVPDSSGCIGFLFVPSSKDGTPYVRSVAFRRCSCCLFIRQIWLGVEQRYCARLVFTASSHTAWMSKRDEAGSSEFVTSSSRGLILAVW